MIRFLFEMKKSYIETKAGASIGGEGSPNEQNQDEIHEGGPGVSGAKWTEFE